MIDALTLIPEHLKHQRVLDHGEIVILDCMPRLIDAPDPMFIACDTACAEAARTSYQAGTKAASSDVALIDNLMRNNHNSPLEMCEIKFYLRLPIFVMRQLVRHRTSNLNEESARYSVLRDDFYVPTRWAENTDKDKQATDQSTATIRHADWAARIAHHNATSYALYEQLLSEGLAREQARMVLGTNIYTSCVWKCDLHNFMHMLRLRLDSHAQYEIRVFAEAMFNVAQVLFPAAIASFLANRVNAATLNRDEASLLVQLARGTLFEDLAFPATWSKRRRHEFQQKINTVLPQGVNA